MKLENLPPDVKLNSYEITNSILKARINLAKLDGALKILNYKSVIINHIFIPLEAKYIFELEGKSYSLETLLVNFSPEDYATHSEENLNIQNYLDSLLVVKHFYEKENKFYNVEFSKLEDNLCGNNYQNFQKKSDFLTPIMKNLFRFMNNDETKNVKDIDALVKFALIFYQFLNIPDLRNNPIVISNIVGRVYLDMKREIEVSALCFSKYLLENKVEFDFLLEKMKKENCWEEWIIFILAGIEISAQKSFELIKEIDVLFHDEIIKIEKITGEKISLDVLFNMFLNPYVSITSLAKIEKIHKNTATKFLNRLVETGFFEIRKVGRHNFYVNKNLMGVLVDFQRKK